MQIRYSFKILHAETLKRETAGEDAETVLTCTASYLDCVGQFSREVLSELVVALHPV